MNYGQWDNAVPGLSAIILLVCAVCYAFELTMMFTVEALRRR